MLSTCYVIGSMLGIRVTLNKVDSDFRYGECYKREGGDRVL